MTNPPMKPRTLHVYASGRERFVFLDFDIDGRIVFALEQRISAHPERWKPVRYWALSDPEVLKLATFLQAALDRKEGAPVVSSDAA